MNHTMVDMSQADAQVGDEVTVISNQPGDRASIESIAAQHDLFSYELLAHLATDTRRIITK
jgi:alanine racemase